MLWREGPSSVMAKNGGGHLDDGGGPPVVFSDGTEGPIVEGTGMARGVDSAVQEKTGSESSTCPESDHKPTLRRIKPCKRTRSISRRMLKMNFRQTFTSACKKKPDMYQESLEDIIVWSRGHSSFEQR